MGRSITIRADRPAYGGISIGRLDGIVVMVKGALPGETVEAAVDDEKKDYLTATAVTIVEPSPDRVVPSCPYFGRCGGCQLQHASYPLQVGMKETVLGDCLKRIAKVETTLSEPLTGPPWGYRRRAQFKASHGRLGFYTERSRDVVDIASCPLMVDGINDALKRVRPLIKGYDAGELHISYGDGPLALVKAGRGPKSGWDTLAGEMVAAGFRGVTIDMGGKNRLTRGDEYTTYELDGLKYTVSAGSFSQANWALNDKLVRLVCDTLGPLDGKRVADLYAGAGNFALPLARRAAEVVALEESRSAVEDGKRNAKLNGITNCKFIRADAEKLADAGRIDVLVTDPPRAGLSYGALKAVLDARPERLVYISCNPSTFARDIGRLAPAYELESVRLVDFFPQTYHMESVGFMRLR